MKSSIVLHGLELSVLLGWGTAERSQEQCVVVDIHIQFHTLPRACVTDDLADTFCYDAFVSEIKKRVAAREFRLIEHLGHDLYQLCREHLPKDALVTIRGTKKPPIANLTGGVSFCCGDEVFAW